MAGNLRLRRSNHIDEITDTNLLFRHEVNKTKTGWVGESAEQLIQRD